MSELKENVRKGVFWSALQNSGSAAISTLVFLVLARLLSPDEVGLVALAQVFVLFVSVFVKQGLGTAIVQRHDLTREHVHSVFWGNVAFGLLFCVGCLVLAEPIGWLLREPRIVPFLRALSPCFLIGGLALTPESLLQREFRFRALATAALVDSVAGGAVGLFLALRGFGAWSIVGLQLTSMTVNLVVLYRLVDWRPAFVFSWTRLREMLRFGLSVMGMNVVSFLAMWADQLVVGALLGSTALGYYAVAQRVVRFLLRVLTQTVNSVVLPAFSRLQTEPERMRRAFYAACRLTSVLSFPAFFGILALAPQTMSILFGDAYLPAAGAMRWLAVAGLLQSVSFYNDPVLLATGRATQALWLRTSCSVLLVAMVALGAHLGSFTGVAFAYAANNLLIAVPWLLALRRAIGVRIAEYVPQLSSATLASLVMGGAVLAASRLSLGSGHLDYTLSVAVGVAAYVVALFTIDPGQVREVLELVSNRRGPRHADSG